jgi:hypothetical protein
VSLVSRITYIPVGNSPVIAKIRNAEAGGLGLKAAGQELIRGSLARIIHEGFELQGKSI